MDMTLFKKYLANRQNLLEAHNSHVEFAQSKSTLNEAKKTNPTAEKNLQAKMRLVAKEFFYDKVYRGNSMEVKDKNLLKELEALGLNKDLLTGKGSFMVLWWRYAKKHGVPADAFAQQLLDWHESGLESYSSKETKALKSSGYSEDDIIKVITDMPEIKNGRSI